MSRQLLKLEQRCHVSWRKNEILEVLKLFKRLLKKKILSNNHWVNINKNGVVHVGRRIPQKKNTFLAQSECVKGTKKVRKRSISFKAFPNIYQALQKKKTFQFGKRPLETNFQTKNEYVFDPVLIQFC